MESVEHIWVEKYRPKKIEDLILPKEYKDIFQKYIDKQEIPNLLFSSNTPGLGKSSLAKVLANETDADVLFLNGNRETGIDIFRGKVLDFCSSISIDGNPKIIFVDECLEENEKIKTPAGSVSLKDIKENEYIDCYSLNTETGEIELDKAMVISSKETEVYEIEMNDGRTIKVTGNHPFICIDKNGNYYKKTIDEGLDENDNIVDYNDLKSFGCKTQENNFRNINTCISGEMFEKLESIHPNIDFVVRDALEQYLKDKRLER